MRRRRRRRRRKSRRRREGGEGKKEKEEKNSDYNSSQILIKIHKHATQACYTSILFHDAQNYSNVHTTLVTAIENHLGIQLRNRNFEYINGRSV
tara:strand:- start:302 stop:583 length:282 start_codon:yes stop_codon:yes gene_type:complete